MNDIHKKVIRQSVFAGVLSMLLLSLFYFLVLTWVTGDWSHPFKQFVTLKYWMSLLFLGFGLQGGLFWYMRLAVREQKARRVAATNAGVSTATMIACCAHHLADIAPMLGISAVSIVLAKYQVYLLALGILFNAFGIWYMSHIIKKHMLYTLHPSHI